MAVDPIPVARDASRHESIVADSSARKLNIREAAAYLGLSASNLNKLRITGTGPRFLKLGRRVLYDCRDLEWVADRKRFNTSESRGSWREPLMGKKQLASRDDLFAVCADRFPEPVARVASILLFWSQLAQHHFRGRLGIYKTDADIAAEIRKHPKTAGRLVVKVCALPGTTFASDLFVMAYGPKPRAHSGRVRWLFRTALGDQLIDKALELAGVPPSAEASCGHQRKQISLTGHCEILLSVTAKCSHPLST